MTSIEQFCKAIAGFSVAGCAVRHRNTLQLLLREDYTQWTDWKEEGHYPAETALEKRLVNVFLDDEDWGWATLYNFDLSAIGAMTQPEQKAVVVSIDGGVYAIGSGSDGMETNLSELAGSPRVGFNRLKTIDGQLFACGGDRDLAQRLGVNRWRWFGEHFERAPLDPSGIHEPVGFDDVDGFSVNDMYLVGGFGDVWHFDGKSARRIDFPSNLPLNAVCCGADGQVYVGGYEGCLFVGRGDKWREIKGPRLSMPLMEMTWHDGKVWATNDFGVWWIDKNGIRQAELPVSVAICAGHVSANDGVLMLAGLHGAAYQLDGRWTQIYSYADMISKAKEAGQLDGVLRARWQEFRR
ncbi:MAG TPA: hypothetical protein VEY92_02445 [Pseudoxanthomonas sp.]|nr:hypothetical protein [Pseudoxanthomonas sp.]